MRNRGELTLTGHPPHHTVEFSRKRGGSEMEWNKNKTIATVSFAFSLFVIILAFQIQTPPSATMDYLGPKGFPLIISGLLMICSVGIFFTKISSEESEEVGIQEIINLLPFIVIVFLFLMILPYIGMVIGIFLLMMTLIQLIEKGKWMKNAIISASVSLGIWVIFAQILNISIPAWPSIM